MQVKYVHLIECEVINKPLYILRAKEMACHVKHLPAMPVFRPVTYGTRGYYPGPRLNGGRLNRGRKQLPDGLDAPEQPRRPDSSQGHNLPGNDKLIALLAQLRITFVYGKKYVSLPGFATVSDHPESEAG
ncbi:MAG: hypothetical protein BWY89_01698 [Bacteroidetes bacterium ADurb.BinA012]|nr:MAG: hypothetical protein BWY89_01698 [Bacteroidetes bacterium ADurb.BinA012]